MKGKAEEKLPTSPDWATAPDWAVAFAIDEDGTGAYYGEDPDWYLSGWDVPLRTPVLEINGKFDSANWRKSIQKRPKK